MATIAQIISEQQKQALELVKSILPNDINTIKEDIIKAKKAEIGTISTHGGIKVRKEANGWVPVKEGGEGKKSESEANTQSNPEALAEHAKKASEQALINATKQSTDPAVRSAAHKEMMRRKNEEAQETFKAPEGHEKESESKLDTEKISDLKRGAEELKKRIKKYNEDSSDKNLESLNDAERHMGETETKKKAAEEKKMEDKEGTEEGSSVKIGDREYKVGDKIKTLTYPRGMVNDEIISIKNGKIETKIKPEHSIEDFKESFKEGIHGDVKKSNGASNGEKKLKEDSKEDIKKSISTEDINKTVEQFKSYRKEGMSQAEALKKVIIDKVRNNF